MAWLNRKRRTVYIKIFLTLYACYSAIPVISAAISGNDRTDSLARLLGADYSSYWVAPTLAKPGTPAAVYNPQEFLATHEAFFKLKSPLLWLYPPTHLLLILPALAAWLGLTLSAYLAVMRRIAPHPLTLWPAWPFWAEVLGLF